jgi:chromate transport protein ChrA
MAVAFLMYGASTIARKVIHNTQGWTFLIIATILAYLYPSPYMTPVLLLCGGLAAALNFKKHEKMEKGPIRIKWRPIIFWISVLVVAAIIGKITNSLPVRLFENFYRNGSLVFGGGQVLIPILYNEFVEFKHYLTEQEFLAGMALTQIVPGPVFSIATFVGSVSLQSHGWFGQVIGGFVATAGIFLLHLLRLSFLGPAQTLPGHSRIARRHSRCQLRADHSRRDLALPTHDDQFPAIDHGALHAGCPLIWQDPFLCHHHRRLAAGIGVLISRFSGRTNFLCVSLPYNHI